MFARGAAAAADTPPASDPGGHGAAQGAVLAYIGMGANLGDRMAALRAAVVGMGQLPGTRLERVSPLYGTAPVGAVGPDYLNAVAELTTVLAPLRLLHALQALELNAGRERPYRNAPRTLDLDILCFGDEAIASPELTVPHPRMTQRAFVLRPLADLAPRRVTPAALDAVAWQAITRLQGPDWARD